MYVCPRIAVGNVISSVIYHVTCSFNSSLGEVRVALLVTDGLEFEPVLGGSWLFIKNLWSRSINPFRAVPLQKRIGTWNLIVGPDLFVRNSSVPVLLEELGNCSSSSLEDSLNSSSLGDSLNLFFCPKPGISKIKYPPTHRFELWWSLKQRTCKHLDSLKDSTKSISSD